MSGFDLPTAPQAQALAFPFKLSFKLIAISNQFELTDAHGNCVGYVKQPWTKIKEVVTVYSNADMNTVLHTIKADRIIDFGAKYAIANAQGSPLGVLEQYGMKSLLKAHFVLQTTGGAKLTISETNPWVKVLDSFVGQIPVIGWLTGYFLQPRYAVCNESGVECLEIKKQPSFFERSFQINSLTPQSATNEQTTLLACLMVILLEAKRG